MEIIDIRKVNRFLQLTGQEDLDFVKKLLFDKDLRKNILRDCYIYTRVKDYKKEYSIEDYIETLYVEFLLDTNLEYYMLYEDFAHAVVWSSAGGCLINPKNSKEFIALEKHIDCKRRDIRYENDKFWVKQFFNKTYNYWSGN